MVVDPDPLKLKPSGSGAGAGQELPSRSPIGGESGDPRWRLRSGSDLFPVHHLSLLRCHNRDTLNKWNAVTFIKLGSGFRQLHHSLICQGIKDHL